MSSSPSHASQRIEERSRGRLAAADSETEEEQEMIEDPRYRLSPARAQSVPRPTQSPEERPSESSARNLKQRRIARRQALDDTLEGLRHTLPNTNQAAWPVLAGETKTISLDQAALLVALIKELADMYHAAVGTGAQAASEKQTEQPAPSRMTKGKGRGKGKSRRQVMEVVMVARRQNAGQAATPLADPSAIASGEPIVPTADGHLENVGNVSSNPNSAAENSTAPTPTIPAKRKPGRPKKVVPPAIPPPTNANAAVEDVVQPRAALFARLSPPVVPIKTQDGPELSSPEIVKRPRGRPRKNIAAVTNQSGQLCNPFYAVTPPAAALAPAHTSSARLTRTAAGTAKTERRYGQRIA